MKKFSMLICLVLFLLISIQSGISADTEKPLPDTPSSTVEFRGFKEVIKIGELYKSELSGLSFEHPVGLKQIQFSFPSEYEDESRELNEIVIPAFTAETNANSNQVGIKILGYFHDGDKPDLKHTYYDVIFKSSDDVVVINRDVIKSWENLTNYGKPYKLVFRFEVVVEGKMTFNNSHVIKSLYQSGPIEFYTEAVDAYIPENRIYQDHELHVTWKNAGIGADTFSVSRANRVYFETSDIVVASEQTDEYHPGDEVKLNFTIQNTSKLTNSLVVLGFDAFGLTIVQKDNPADDEQVWRKIGNRFYLSLKSGDTWAQLTQDNVHTFSQTFKIDSDYMATEINIAPFILLQINDEKQSKPDFNTELKLIMAGELIDEEQEPDDNLEDEGEVTDEDLIEDETKSSEKGDVFVPKPEEDSSQDEVIEEKLLPNTGVNSNRSIVGGVIFGVGAIALLKLKNKRS